MATITPTRFGLKYAPIPTLALEYEEDLGVVEDESGTRSLYVVKETTKATKHVRKKLHVVELPQLTSHSEAHTIAQQLQKDDHRFLGPSVVKEQQLKRLLQQLVDQLRGAGGFSRGQDDHTADAEGDGDEDELGQSAMDESIAEASASMDVSKAEEESRDEGERHDKTLASRSRGKFITQDDEENEDEEAEASASNYDDGARPPTRAAPTEEERHEAEEDEKKKKVLKSDSDGSENEEEDVQSEELEYFSEDGSDEDSF